MAETASQVSYNAFRRRILFSLCLHLLILCVLGCFVEGRPRTLKRCGRRDSQVGKIVGGKDVQPGEYPWMVSIQIHTYTGKFDHLCGGTILNENYIVTAAHCIGFSTQPWLYEIYTGLHQLSEKSTKTVKGYSISKAIIHENFNDSTLHDDIALLRTKEPIKFEGMSGYVNGICLPYDDNDPTGWAIVTGWGLTEEKRNWGSDVLQAVKVPIVSREDCFKAYQKNSTIIIDTQHICAGMVNRDSCQMDSGGPLMQKNKRGTYTLIGIVSQGLGCARMKYPGIYTRVASYMDWLEENMD